MIMTEWKTYKLGDICDYVTSRTANIENYISTENMLPNKGGVCTSSNVPSGAAVEYKVGDILISNIRPYFQKIWQADCKGACSADVLCIRANNKADSKYLYYQLSQQLFFDYVMAGAKGCKMPRGDKKQIMQWSISLPSLEEQRRIAGILGAIDDKIENNRRINANLELQAQVLYKQWFVDFEFPNEEGKPYKSSGGKMVESELGQIPEGWSVGDIYKYVNVVYGAPYKSVLFNERKDGNPLIRIRDLKTFSPQYYTQEILPNTEFINAGDVVAGMDAEFVPCLWMGEKGVLNQRCCKFVGKQDSISNYYVMFLVKPELEFVQSYKTGTTVSHLGKADIDKFVVVQPPFAVIENFSKIADALLNNKIKLAKENINLATLRDTLLPKLMNGEIKL